MTVVGIDVGGRRKGFHGCAIEGRALVAGPTRLPTVAEAVRWVADLAPTTIALDSPCEGAPPGSGEASRPDERALNAEVCGIRWTPEREQIRGAYYAWILHGFELYEALAEDVPGAETIEVFPTAAWTRWIGPRDRSRAAWTALGMEKVGASALDLTDLPAKLGKPRLNQDDRDAVAAALVARQHEEGLTQAFGKLIVPAGPLP
jgi:predicted nuclease with RNAse H fold